MNEAIVEASINPYGVDYGGRHGVEWTNLPIDARRMVEEAVPFGVATVETGDVRLEWTDRGAGAALVVSQTIWFERQSKDVLVGVYASRSRAGGLSAGGDEQAQAWIEPQPWGVAAFRCAIDAKGSARALPARGADGPPLPPSNQGRALPPTAH